MNIHMEDKKYTLYTSNEEVWKSILEDCSKAEKSIDLEQFIFINDEFGKKLIDICKERAEKGVRVRFLWDAGGSFSFSGSSIIQELKEKKIELMFWKTLIPNYFNIPDYRAWFLRNHRRTIVIDKKIGYTGSICIETKLKNWRDTNVRLQGLVVKEMAQAFNRMWMRARRQTPLPPYMDPKDPEFNYVTNNPTPGRRYMYSALLEAIRNARSYIYITTPYFAPTARLARVIKLAAHRKVDVRILIPEKSDHFIVDLGARSYFDTLLRSGVRIFLYSGNMIHSKAVVIDGKWASVGTLNMDSASLLYNFEANIVTSNSKFAEEIVSHFVHDTQESSEIMLDEWRKRFFLEKILELLIRLIRKFL